MSQTLTFSVELTTIDCGKCGGTYAINERYRRQKHDNGGTWTCPYCKTGCGYTESEVQRLQRALDAKKRREEVLETQLRDADKKLIAERAAKARIANRIVKGVCPCCNRSFANVKRHMVNKHPEFAVEKAE